MWRVSISRSTHKRAASLSVSTSARLPTSQPIAQSPLTAPETYHRIVKRISGIVHYSTPAAEADDVNRDFLAALGMTPGKGAPARPRTDPFEDSKSTKDPTQETQPTEETQSIQETQPTSARAPADKPHPQKQKQKKQQQPKPAVSEHQSIDEALTNITSIDSTPQRKSSEPLTGIALLESYGMSRNSAAIQRWVDQALSSDPLPQWTQQELEQIYTVVATYRRLYQDTSLIERIWSHQLSLQIPPTARILYQMIKNFTRYDEELVKADAARHKRLVLEQRRLEEGDEKAKEVAQREIKRLQSEIEKLGKGDNIEKAVALATESMNVGLSLLPPSYAFIISAYAARNEMSTAEEWFQKLLQSSHQPNAATYATMITGYAASNDLYNAQKWFEQYEQSRLAPADEPYLAFAQALARSGKVDGAVDVVERVMPGTKLSVTMKGYDAILSGLAQAGEVREAKELLERVERERKANPSSKSYEIIFVSAVENGELEIAKGLLDKAHLQWESLGAFVRLAIRQGDFTSAVEAQAQGILKGAYLENNTITTLITALVNSSLFSESITVITRELKTKPNNANQSAHQAYERRLRTLISIVTSAPLPLPLALQLHHAAHEANLLTWQDRQKLVDAYESNFKLPNRGMDTPLTVTDFELIFQAQMTKRTSTGAIGTRLAEILKDMEKRGLVPSPRVVTVVENGFDKMGYPRGKEGFRRILRTMGVLKDSGLGGEGGVKVGNDGQDAAEKSKKLFALLSGDKIDLQGAKKIYEEIVGMGRFLGMAAAGRFVYVLAMKKEFEYALGVLERGWKYVEFLKGVEKSRQGSGEGGEQKVSRAMQYETTITHSIVRGYLQSGRYINPKTQKPAYLVNSVLAAETVQTKLSTSIAGLVWEYKLCSDMLATITSCLGNVDNESSRRAIVNAGIRVFTRLESGVRKTGNGAIEPRDYDNLLRLLDSIRNDKRIVEVWEEMHRKTLTPTDQTYLYIIRALARLSDRPKTMALFEEYLERSWVKPDMRVFDAVMGMLVRNDRFAEA
ncbi:hypothetical protein HK097_001004, partial [Rhizophlyctis rosea]